MRRHLQKSTQATNEVRTSGQHGRSSNDTTGSQQKADNSYYSTTQVKVDRIDIKLPRCWKREDKRQEGGQWHYGPEAHVKNNTPPASPSHAWRTPAPTVLLNTPPETPYLSLRKSTTQPFRYETPTETPSSPNLLDTTDDESLVENKKATEQQTKEKEIDQEKGDEENQAQTSKQSIANEKEEEGKKKEAKTTQEEDKDAGETQRESYYQAFSTPASSTSSQSSSS